MSLCYSKTTSMSLLWELVGNADSLWLGPSDSESAFYSEWFRCTLPSEKQIGGSLLGARLSEEIMKIWNGSLQPRQWKTVKRSAVICRSFGNPCPQTPHPISRIAAKHLSPPSRKNGVKGKKRKKERLGTGRRGHWNAGHSAESCVQGSWSPDSPGAWISNCLWLGCFTAL